MSILQTLKDKITAVFSAEPTQLKQVKTQHSEQSDALFDQAVDHQTPLEDSSTVVETASKPESITEEQVIEAQAPIASTEKQGANEVSDAAALAAVAEEKIHSEQIQSAVDSDITDEPEVAQTETAAIEPTTEIERAAEPNIAESTIQVEEIPSNTQEESFIPQPAEAVGPAIIEQEENSSSAKTEFERDSTDETPPKSDA